MVQRKKAMSDLVSTVLLVLITIAAVGIVYAAIMPLIRSSVETSQKCNDLGLEVNKESGYTCLSGNNVRIQVSRGPSDAILYGVQLQLIGGGASKTLNVYNDTTKNTDSPVKLYGKVAPDNIPSVPGKNEMITYTVDRTDTKVAMASVETVAVAPIILTGQKENLCNMLPPVTISSCI